MLCELCGQREATLKIKRIINNEISEIHICADCMKKQFSGNSYFDVSFFINQLINLLGYGGEKKNADIECPSCGMKFGEFSKTGKLGCDKCYTSFAPMLDPLIRKIHGCERYEADKPSDEPPAHTEKDEKLRELQEKLDMAVKAEKYEDACRFRDEIKAVKDGKQ